MKHATKIPVEKLVIFGVIELLDGYLWLFHILTELKAAFILGINM